MQKFKHALFISLIIIVVIINGVNAQNKKVKIINIFKDQDTLLNCFDNNNEIITYSLKNICKMNLLTSCNSLIKADTSGYISLMQSISKDSMVSVYFNVIDTTNIEIEFAGFHYGGIVYFLPFDSITIKKNPNYKVEYFRITVKDRIRKTTKFEQKFLKKEKAKYRIMYILQNNSNVFTLENKKILCSLPKYSLIQIDMLQININGFLFKKYKGIVYMNSWDDDF